MIASERALCYRGAVTDRGCERFCAFRTKIIEREIDRGQRGADCDCLRNGLDPISIVSAVTPMTESTELVEGKVNLHNK